VKTLVGTLLISSWLGLSTDFFIGFVTGGVTAVATEPIDCVTQRLMVQSDAGKKKGMAFGYAGLVDGIRVVAATEGVLSLWKGVVPRFAVKSIGSAIWLAVYSLLQRHL